MESLHIYCLRQCFLFQTVKIQGDKKGEKKKRFKEVIEEVPDIYFSRLATDLLNDEIGKQEKQQASRYGTRQPVFYALL